MQVRKLLLVKMMIKKRIKVNIYWLVFKIVFCVVVMVSISSLMFRANEMERETNELIEFLYFTLEYQREINKKSHDNQLELTNNQQGILELLIQLHNLDNKIYDNFKNKEPIIQHDKAFYPLHPNKLLLLQQSKKTTYL